MKQIVREVYNLQLWRFLEMNEKNLIEKKREKVEKKMELTKQCYTLQQHVCDFFFVRVPFMKWMNERNKQKWIRLSGLNVCDGKRCTFSRCVCRGHKESGDSLVMNYRQNEMTAIQTHILYLIDLAVYYFDCIMANERKRKASTEWASGAKTINNPHGNGCTKKAKRCWNEKSASVLSFFCCCSHSDFMVHCFFVFCFCRFSMFHKLCWNLIRMFDSLSCWSASLRC